MRGQLEAGFDEGYATPHQLLDSSGESMGIGYCVRVADRCRRLFKKRYLGRASAKTDFEINANVVYEGGYSSDCIGGWVMIERIASR